jgi:hypothetical protein
VPFEEIDETSTIDTLSHSATAAQGGTARPSDSRRARIKIVAKPPQRS